jgi:acetylornithine deacetylase
LSLPDLLDLHQELVECPSVSGNESAIADLVEAHLKTLHAMVERVGNNVLARSGVGPRILLNSHLDTVPAHQAWTRDAYKLTVEGDRRYGLGSNDAKASVAAMMKAFEQVSAVGGPAEVILLLVPEEETGGGGMQVAWPFVKQRNLLPAGAVVGEPTGLDVALSQKGLLILELIAEGDACHSANAKAQGARNPIRILAKDLIALEAINLGAPHPFLGETTLEPTVIQGGERRNMIPPMASAYLDLRTEPNLGHSELISRVESLVSSRVRVHSNRFFPKQCDAQEVIAQAARLARPGAKFYGSRTLSDWVYLDVPAIKVGPGRTERSHTPDEFVLESELYDGVAFYLELIASFADLASRGSTAQKEEQP